MKKNKDFKRNVMKIKHRRQRDMLRGDKPTVDYTNTARARSSQDKIPTLFLKGKDYIPKHQRPESKKGLYEYVKPRTVYISKGATPKTYKVFSKT